MFCLIEYKKAEHFLTKEIMFAPLNAEKKILRNFSATRVLP